MRIDWTKWGTVLSAVMLILVAIQVLVALNIRLPMDFFYEDSYTMYTLTDPLPADILPELRVSPIYYIEVSVDIPGKANYNKDVKFIISTIDKGKNHIIEPKLKAFVVDSLGNIRGVYPNLLQNSSGYNISVNKKFNLVFKSPPADQKIIGAWKIYIYILDDNAQELASYAVYEFNYIDENKLWLNIGYLSIFFTIGLIIFQIIYISRYLYRRSIKEKVSINPNSISSEAMGTDAELLECAINKIIQKEENEPQIRPKTTPDFPPSNSTTKEERSDD